MGTIVLMSLCCCLFQNRVLWSLNLTLIKRGETVNITERLYKNLGLWWYTRPRSSECCALVYSSDCPNVRMWHNIRKVILFPLILLPKSSLGETIWTGASYLTLPCDILPAFILWVDVSGPSSPFSLRSVWVWIFFLLLVCQRFLLIYKMFHFSVVSRKNIHKSRTLLDIN